MSASTSLYAISGWKAGDALHAEINIKSEIADWVSVSDYSPRTPDPDQSTKEIFVEVRISSSCNRLDVVQHSDTDAK